MPTSRARLAIVGSDIEIFIVFLFLPGGVVDVRLCLNREIIECTVPSARWSFFAILVGEYPNEPNGKHQTFKRGTIKFYALQY
ncbi:hypothetical protein BLNAU_8623 [Blattamonas nauphoetae]|uniref:Uncharacterized protein n=1 Tax=Blattamonas nauphoetae TaxID=2049346 RepID=A0ABQ9XY26_9EUKA|nr:hypothetical protein BLNAU_8623 [Blattamonas nauphoetae]